MIRRFVVAICCLAAVVVALGSAAGWSAHRVVYHDGPRFLRVSLYAGDLRYVHTIRLEQKQPTKTLATYDLKRNQARSTKTVSLLAGGLTATGLDDTVFGRWSFYRFGFGMLGGKLRELTDFRWNHPDDLRMETTGGTGGGATVLLVRLKIPAWLSIPFLLAYPMLRLVRGPLRRRRRRKRGLCLQCGYNLTGNTSGVCPECAAKVEG